MTTDGADDEDPLVYLERKKSQLAALQEAQKLAEQQAQMARGLQERMRALEAMTQEPSGGNGGNAGGVAPQLQLSSPSASANGRRGGARYAPGPALVVGSGVGPGVGPGVGAGVGASSSPLKSSLSGPGGNAQTSSLSVEDRLRFGLDVDVREAEQEKCRTRSQVLERALREEQQASPQHQGLAAMDTGYAAAPAASAAQRAATAPLDPPQQRLARPLQRTKGSPWSSLSAEDRKRLGLDEDSDLDEGSPVRLSPVRQPRVDDHPLWDGLPRGTDGASPLWGAGGGSGAQHGRPSMHDTIWQLEHLGLGNAAMTLRTQEQMLHKLRYA